MSRICPRPSICFVFVSQPLTRSFLHVAPHTSLIVTSTRPTPLSCMRLRLRNSAPYTRLTNAQCGIIEAVFSCDVTFPWYTCSSSTYCVASSEAPCVCGRTSIILMESGDHRYVTRNNSFVLDYDERRISSVLRGHTITANRSCV